MGSSAKVLHVISLKFHLYNDDQIYHQEAKDFLQLMLEASSDDMETAEDENATVESTEDKSSSSSSSIRKTLTDDEVVSLAIMFLLAGYETTSSALAYTSYLLAINPSKQEKLCAEIDAYFEENEVNMPYNSIFSSVLLCVYTSVTTQEGSVHAASQSLQYLDWVFQESLRLYPPGSL